MVYEADPPGNQVRYRLGRHPETGAQVLVWEDFIADPDEVAQGAMELRSRGIPGLLLFADQIRPANEELRHFQTLYVTARPEGTSLATTMKALGWLDDAMLLVVLHGLFDVLQRVLAEGFIHPYFAEQDDEIFFGTTPITLLQRIDLYSRHEASPPPPRAELTAPELIMSGKPATHDQRIYVYRVGMLAYQWLTGETYFRGKGHHHSIPQFLYDIFMGPTPTASERAAERNGVGIPRWFDTWFALATNRDPDHRFPSLREAQIALRRLAG